MDSTLDYKQNEIALKKINQILKDKITSLEIHNQELKKTNRDLTKNDNSPNMLSKYSLALIGSVFVVGIFVPLDADFFSADSFVESFTQNGDDTLKSKYVIENLRGDIIETTANWRLTKDAPLHVSIVNSKLIDSDKLTAIKNSITSTEQIWLDDSLTHKGPKGTESLYFSGWQGAINDLVLRETMFNPPERFNIFTSDISEGNIVIVLETVEHPEGYSGFTKNIVEDSEILKSYITIYNVNQLSESELNTIVKHEFGHALGLAHSTDPQDLMYPVIETDYPIISDCNIDALESVYDGNVNSKVVCTK